MPALFLNLSLFLYLYHMDKVWKNSNIKKRNWKEEEREGVWVEEEKRVVSLSGAVLAEAARRD